jgi:hypothetical protein
MTPDEMRQKAGSKGSPKFLLLEDGDSRTLIRVDSIDEVRVHGEGVMVFRTSGSNPRTLECTTSFDEVLRRLGQEVKGPPA